MFLQQKKKIDTKLSRSVSERRHGQTQLRLLRPRGARCQDLHAAVKGLLPGEAD